MISGAGWMAMARVMANNYRCPGRREKLPDLEVQATESPLSFLFDVFRVIYGCGIKQNGR